MYCFLTCRLFSVNVLPLQKIYRMLALHSDGLIPKDNSQRKKIETFYSFFTKLYLNFVKKELASKLIKFNFVLVALLLPVKYKYDNFEAFGMVRQVIRSRLEASRIHRNVYINVN